MIFIFEWTIPFKKKSTGTTSCTLQCGGWGGNTWRMMHWSSPLINFTTLWESITQRIDQDQVSKTNTWNTSSILTFSSPRLIAQARVTWHVCTFFKEDIYARHTQKARNDSWHLSTITNTKLMLNKSYLKLQLWIFSF